MRYGLSALYYTQVRRLSGRCLELCEQEQPGATSQVKRRPEEKVCRRQPGYGVWGRVIYLIQDVVSGPESVARGRTRSAQSLLKYLKEGQEILSRRTASKQNANLDYTAKFRFTETIFSPSRYSSFPYLHLGKFQLIKMIINISKNLHEFANVQAR